MQNLHHHRLNAVHSLVLLALRLLTRLLRLLSPAGVFSLESRETVEKGVSLPYHMGFAQIALILFSHHFGFCWA